MLYKNDIFELHGKRVRLLHCVQSEDTAWVMDVEDPKAWPIQVSWQYIRNQEKISDTVKAVAQAEDTDDELTQKGGEGVSRLRSAHTSPAAIRLRDRAMKILGDLPQKTDQIFDPAQRTQLVIEQANAARCSMPTVYKHLRRYWVGGQTPSALLGDFHICGRVKDGLTGRRGAKPEFERAAYQLGDRDVGAFEREIKRYLGDERLTISASFQNMLESSYTSTDGNGDDFLLPEGERPTQRQFEYYLRKQYPVHVRKRARTGDAKYDLNHRAELGTVLDDCLGVGHYYEADATIADVYLVASDDIKKIIGKPTIYLIIDRKSRLIVGWYVGLENASWICAMQAFMSISQDKQAMCERLGVEYNPSDWPAHQVFPKIVIADRGEVLTKDSEQLAADLDVRVINLPSKRADLKSVVESGFMQKRRVLQAGAPGFDPPENAKMRQGKRYDKDASMTLAQFERIIVLLIIAHNRRPILEYPLSLKEIGDGVAPIPIEIWNHGIVERSGQLPRYDEHTVRMALQSQGDGTVSERGVAFGGCFYSCAHMAANGWFERAKNRHFKVKLSFDRRLVDTVFVRDPAQPGRVFKCQLTSASEKFRGLSFCEVSAIEKMVRAGNVKHKQIRHEVDAEFNKRAKPVYAQAKKALADAKLPASRAHRRADTKAARAQELQVERMRNATQTSPKPDSSGMASAQVIPLSAHIAVAAENKLLAGASAGQESTPEATNRVLTPQEKLNKFKNRLING